MSKQKRIIFGIIILAIIGSIFYLEGQKVHPTSSGNPSQALNVDATTSTTSTASSTSVNAATVSSLSRLAAADRAAGYSPAIEIAGPTGFINAPAGFKLASLIGKKVILLDFWTYSCINCVRTIPYLNAWYQKYKDQGLVIVGIHTPEFEFEKDIANVQQAVTNYGIQYPVILDSNQGTWDAYNNLYWPHEYLIDLAGYIVHDHVGEGSYAETEVQIQKLLADRARILGADATAVATGTVDIAPPNLGEILSPETYFGAARNSLLANGTFFANGIQTLVTPQAIDMNKLYLSGTWDFKDQYATNLSASASVTYKYDAGNVYMVAAGIPSGTTVQVLQDGMPISAAAGADVKNGKMVITGNRLYNVVKNPDGGGIHTLQLIIQEPGLSIFTFTFG